MQKLDTLAAQETLLNQVFPDGDLSYKYLDWLYRKSPDGPDIPSDYLESGKLLGHYTVIPQHWNFNGEIKLLALSLNTAVHEEARGKGLFVRLADESYSAAASQGIQAIIGVANANSTPGFLRRLGFTLICPLPVVAGLVVPSTSKKIKSHAISSDFLSSSLFNSLTETLSSEPGRAAKQQWNTEKLRWRLGSPRSRYAFHTHDSGVLITTVARLPLRIPAVVALKFLPNTGYDQVDSKALIKQACALHRTPFFIYSGFNENATVTGTSLPRRFLPSPLNLIYRRLNDSMPTGDDVQLGTFEFLDFDAY